MSQDSSGTLAFQTKMTWQMFLFTMTTIPPQKVCLGMSPAPSLIRDTWKTLDSHSSLHILQSLLPVKSVIIWMWNKPTFDDSNLHEWQVLVCLTWSHKSLFLYTEHSECAVEQISKCKSPTIKVKVAGIKERMGPPVHVNWDNNPIQEQASPPAPTAALLTKL